MCNVYLWCHYYIPSLFSFWMAASIFKLALHFQQLKFVFVVQRFFVCEAFFHCVIQSLLLLLFIMFNVCIKYIRSRGSLRALFSFCQLILSQLVCSSLLLPQKIINGQRAVKFTMLVSVSYYVDMNTSNDVPAFENALHNLQW